MSSAARQLASVDGEEVFAGVDVDARLRQRRLQARIPVLAVVDARDSIPAVLDRVVRAEQARL